MSAQFIEEWNNLFEFKLREVDLQNPTEQILTSALSSYLEHLNINVHKMREDNMHSEESQWQLKAEFCFFIDRLLKVSKPQEQFLYYDLIQPTSKKTIHLLKLLQNFYHFYNMVKSQVEEESNEIVSCYESAVAEHNQCLRENNMAKEKVDRITDKLSNLTENIFELQKSENSLKIKNESIDEKINDIQKQHSQAKLISIELQQDIQVLRTNLVSEHQVQSVKESLAKLDEDFKELSEFEQNTQHRNKDLTDKINTANFDCLSKFLEQNTVADATSAKSLQTEVKSIQRDIFDATAIRAQLHSKLKIKSNELNNIKVLVEEKSSAISQTNLDSINEFSDLMRKKSELQEIQHKLDKKHRQTELQVRDLELQQEYIFRESRNVLSVINSSKG